MTFSIVGRCVRTGQLGVAVSTKVPAVGMLCPFARPGVGAIATQSFVNPYLGADGLELLAQGYSAQETLDRLIADDPGRDVRQLGVVDAQGRSAAFSGQSCVGWFGHQTGEHFTAQGNMLVGAETVEAMAAAFATNEAADLPERLLRALEAGQAAGGDKRGRQSAALYVVDRETAYAYRDLRVDEHPDPVAELRRVFAVAQEQLVPFLGRLPTRENPLGHREESTAG